MLLNLSDVVLLQCVVDVSVEHWLHNVANGVVACNLAVGKRPELEVFSNHSNVRVEALEMRVVVNRLQEDGACVGILGFDTFV